MKNHHLSKQSNLSAYSEKTSFFRIKPVNNNIKKPVLKSSKSKIEEMKKKIYKIIEDNLQFSKIKAIQNKNDLIFHNSSSEAQMAYEENMESLFKKKIDKLNEINNRYNSEIYELQQDIEEEEIIKKNNNKNNNINSSLKLIYENLIDDKNQEIKKMENEFNSKSNKEKDNYKNNFELEEIEDRSVIYRNEMIGNIRVQLEDIINPPSNKKVEFDFDINYYINPSKNHSILILIMEKMQLFYDLNISFEKIVGMFFYIILFFLINFFLLFFLFFLEENDISFSNNFPEYIFLDNALDYLKPIIIYKIL